MGKETATSIVIEKNIDISSYTEDGTHKIIDANGLVWEFLDGNTLRIQTSEDKIIPTNTVCNLFINYEKAKSITGIENLDTSSMSDMRSMFYNCKSLESIDVSSFDTSMVRYMSSMFEGCSSLTTIFGLSNFNTAKVSYMDGMFRYCEKLTSIDLTKFNTSSLKQMSVMFQNCKSLTSLDLSSFTTEELIELNNLVEKCVNLGSLTLSDKFTMEKVDKTVTGSGLSDMFLDCATNVSGGCIVHGVTSQSIKNDLKNKLTRWSDGHMHFEGE